MNIKARTTLKENGWMWFTFQASKFSQDSPYLKKGKIVGFGDMEGNHVNCSP